MKHLLHLHRPLSTTGFTLIEMTIVLVIIALMLSGLTTIFTVLQDNSANKETHQTLTTINEALIGFAATNGRLPRPAQSGTNGIERPANCADDSECTGFIPWQTLGVPKTDSWGTLIRYSVTPAFAHNTPFTLNTSANKQIQSRNNVGTAIYLVGSASGCDAKTNLCAPAVIYSSGKRFRGWRDDGSPITNNSTTNVDEQTNASAIKLFMSRPFSQGGPGGEFDDIITWVPVTVLFNRMIAAGKLP